MDDVFVVWPSSGHFLMDFHEHFKNTASFHTIHDGDGSGQQDFLPRVLVDRGVKQVKLAE